MPIEIFTPGAGVAPELRLPMGEGIPIFTGHEFVAFR